MSVLINTLFDELDKIAMAGMGMMPNRPGMGAMGNMGNMGAMRGNLPMYAKGKRVVGKKGPELAIVGEEGPETIYPNTKTKKGKKRARVIAREVLKKTASEKKKSKKRAIMAGVGGAAVGGLAGDAAAFGTSLDKRIRGKGISKDLYKQMFFERPTSKKQYMDMRKEVKKMDRYAKKSKVVKEFQDLLKGVSNTAYRYGKRRIPAALAGGAGAAYLASK